MIEPYEYFHGGISDMNDDSEGRSYDIYPNLSELIEKLKNSERRDQDKIISGIKDLIMDFDSELIDRHVMEFPLTVKRRWYDKDPYSWLVMNALKYGEEKLIKNVVNYLQKKLKSQIK